MSDGFSKKPPRKGGFWFLAFVDFAHFFLTVFIPCLGFS
tara:strand:+ start:25 stop:141 length:117 start_codon:yes stop_codon:yes gene_type:complete